MQWLQGNLQNVFDALYELGVIDPVLEMDWQIAMRNRPKYERQIDQVVDLVNHFQGGSDLLASALQQFDAKTLEYLAIEVAREFAEFNSRTQLH